MNNCNNCKSYNKELGTCDNTEITNINDVFTGGTADFMDYKVHKDSVVYVGKLFVCKLYQKE